MGCDHTQVGWEIAKDWKLPLGVQEGIKDHHNSGKAIEPGSITGMIQISEYFVNRMEFAPFPGTRNQLPQSLLDHIHSRINEYKAIAMDLPEIIEKADDVFGLE